MLRPKGDIRAFEKYGFKRCKGTYGKDDCYYLCVARGVKMIFISPVMYAIDDWKDTDPRIHKKANCKYRDHRDALDITYELIKDGLLRK